MSGGALNLRGGPGGGPQAALENVAQPARPAVVRARLRGVGAVDHHVHHVRRVPGVRLHQTPTVRDDLLVVCVVRKLLRNAGNENRAISQYLL